MNRLSKIAVSVVVSLLFVAAPAYAQTSSSTADTIAALNAQITALLQQIQQLRTQVMSLQGGTATGTTSTTTPSFPAGFGGFHSYLHEGVDNDEVRSLQQYLSQDPSIYPEGLTTGYYGKLTQKAVERFQRKYGISAVGVVGPQTRAKLNALFGEREGEHTPPGLAKKENNNNYYYNNQTNTTSTSTSTSTATTTPYMGGDDKVTICHNIHHNPHTITVSKAALSAHLRQGDFEGDCSGESEHSGDNNDDNGENEGEGGNNGGGTTTTAPVISALTATNVSTTTADITWTTDQSAMDAVWAGTTTPVTVANATQTAASATLGTSHDLPLAGLLPSTTYYYFVTSTNSAGLVATSSEQSFTTGALTVVDTTPPVIAGVSASAASTTASVTWTTDEDATGQAWIGTTSPLTTANATSTMSESTLGTSHTLSFDGLTASTTYYYFVSSADASGNTATSSESSFTTSQ